jgi:Ca2+-binding RTX toxin-like protein
LQIDGSGLNINNFLTVDGSLETDGSFIITGGAASDTLIGGDKNDTLTGNDSGFLGNELTGNDGSDRFVLNQAQEIAPLTPKTTITDFKAGVDGDVFAISVSAYAGAPAAGSVFKVSTVDAAVNLSTTVLVENGLIGTNTSALTNVRFGVDTATNILYYDANGNFASGSIAIAKSDLALTGLTNNNFIAIA